MILCARREHLNRIRKVDQAAKICESFVYSIVKKQQHDFKIKNITHSLFEKSMRCAKVCGIFFLLCSKAQIASMNKQPYCTGQNWILTGLRKLRQAHDTTFFRKKIIVPLVEGI